MAPRLRQDSCEWLIAHNEEVLSPPVVLDIERVGGPVPAQGRCVGAAEPDGVHLSDAAVDWIEGSAYGGGASAASSGN